MANEVTPYIPRAAGDILSASDWNDLQVKVRKDIGDQIEKALGQVDDVPHSGDSDKLDGKTLDEITQDIIRKTLEAIQKDSGGYVTLFRRLELGEETLIEHGLGAFPLTDVYQLEYFPAVCGAREDYEYEPVRWVNFFLYHGTERRIRIPSREASKPVMIEIEEPEMRPARVKFSDLLLLYDVKYTETTDLEELEADFWDAFFQRPDCDDFDPGQYGHSQWFERCCGERRSVKELKERGDWDRLYLKMRTRKTINLIGTQLLKKTTTKKVSEEIDDIRDKEFAYYKASETNTRIYPRTIVAAPNQIQIVHYDFDTLGVRLIDRPIYAEDHIHGFKHDEKRSFPPLPKEWMEDLKVMILLKV